LNERRSGVSRLRKNPQVLDYQQEAQPDPPGADWDQRFLPWIELHIFPDDSIPAYNKTSSRVMVRRMIAGGD
jgi:hypothetical protein